MCGIVGIHHLTHSRVNVTGLKLMTEMLRHRGPDDEGFLLVNMNTGKVLQSRASKELNLFGETNHPDLGMGHKRLSIIDLSEAGHQPMCNEDGTVWIVYNGEVYNYREIRKELENLGHRLKSQTDTEVILHAYEEWGTECLGRFNGMWAFALVDIKEKRIFCSRDRAGVKPFYYLFDGKQFCFASEIKALLRMDNMTIEPNKQIIADYLFSGLLDHTKETFFRNIYQLLPGEYLLFEGDRLKIQSYWDIEAKEDRFPREDNYAERFYELFEDSIRLRLRSDVPVGTCLSGGLDSSSIVCLANDLMFNGQTIDARLVGERQKTFSSCFENPDYDERYFIEKVIKKTGAEKNYIFPQVEHLFKDLFRLIWHQEEPFGSTSIYAQWSVMKLAKDRGVTVLLDGQGGDELLAGYSPSFYFLISETLKKIDFIRLMKEINGFRKNPKSIPDQFITKMIAALLPNSIKPILWRVTQRRMNWVEDGFQNKYLRHFPKPLKFKHDLNNYLYHIFRTMILPGLLHYEDRNSMAFSLETRLPFLDYRLVEYAFSLPSDQKIKDGVTKVVLRNAMKGILPEEIRNRMDKMGFVTPEDIWIKTILKNQIYDILSSKSFAERGFFNVNKIKKAFEEYCQGKLNIGFLIWRWVNLELWLRTFIDPQTSSESWKEYGN